VGTKGQDLLGGLEKNPFVPRRWISKDSKNKKAPTPQKSRRLKKKETRMHILLKKRKSVAKRERPVKGKIAALGQKGGFRKKKKEKRGRNRLGVLPEESVKSAEKPTERKRHSAMRDSSLGKGCIRRREGRTLGGIGTVVSWPG